MLKIGITGGIGSGKSTVCRIFEKLGVPVYYADNQAKWLMSNQPKLKNKLIENFGEKIFSDNVLNRKLLAEIVFTNHKKLELLNSLVHPAVFEDAEKWNQMHEKAGVAFTLKEAALLYESGSYKTLDKIIVVTAPQEVRISRVMKRDNISREEVMNRINKQMSQEKKTELADYVIENIKIENLNIKVSEVYEKLVYLSRRK